jgi:hypothetical protein
MMSGVETVTGVSVVLIMGFGELIGILGDAAKLAGQAIPDVAKFNLESASSMASEPGTAGTAK